jgi:hypothetical protein
MLTFFGLLDFAPMRSMPGKNRVDIPVRGLGFAAGNRWQDFGLLRVAAIAADGAEDQVAEVGIYQLSFVADFYVAQAFARAFQQLGGVREFGARAKPNVTCFLPTMM